MKITHVEYSALYNLGNYNNEKVGLRAELEEGETPEEAVKALREKAILLNEGSQGTAAELYNSLYQSKSALREIERRIQKATEQWNQVAEFLKAQGLKPDAPILPTLPLLGSGEVIEPDLEDVCY